MKIVLKAASMKPFIFAWNQGRTAINTVYANVICARKYQMLSEDRLRIILKHTQVMARPVRDNYQEQARRVKDEIDAMTEVLGFKIDWSHDSRPFEDIIWDECNLTVVTRDTETIDCRTIILEKVKLLRRIEQCELDFCNAIHNTEIKYD